MKPVILAGNPALSSFRTEELKKKITSETGLVIDTIEATEVFFLEIKEEPDDGQREKIHSLLGASGPFSQTEGFFVTPRLGTISPWSSKATDIFHNCGLTGIARVEHGLYYRLTDDAGTPLPAERTRPVLPFLYDRMVEGVYESVDGIFAHQEPAPLVTVDILGQGREALTAANTDMGLAINDEEIDYLYETYKKMDRNPTDVELVMFGQVNSEHCRHKIFNASWVVDGEEQDRSLFSMIRNTHETHPDGTLVAYKDNSAVIEGGDRTWFEVNPDGTRRYSFRPTQQDIILKVETHNHPTAISPYPGAATGVGGEIRDESATGTGSKSKAGLAGFMVSNLRVPGFKQPWERDYAPFPSRLASPLAIMTDGPLGGARFGNEFGRPQLFGFFRTYEDNASGTYRGYHKPIMIAGGMGNIKRAHAHKKDIPAASFILQIGGPAMRIGLGGGAASSMATGSNAEDLDFNSVQRDNAEIQRRCQEVIDACIALDDGNPILSIHDIGAGGLSNGCPELVEEVGGAFKLRAIHNEERSMSPMEIWCNESQERYVLAVGADDLDRFLALCTRERCPVAVLGEATGDGHLSLYDEHFDNKPIDMDLQVLLGHPPKMERDVTRRTRDLPHLDLTGIDLQDAADRIMRLPAVAKKTFLITIADRSITGLVTRDQMTGPWQEPVADVAVTASTLNAVTGEAMSMGERTPLALISAPASGRMAIGEALTNMAAADIGPIGNIKLSANWMCACGEEGEDADLFDTVRAVGMELCPQLGISIPVGKDSLSMRTLWQTPDGRDEKILAPLSLIVSAFAPVNDVRNTVTPDLKPGGSVLLLADLGHRKNRLGGSCLAQVYNQVGKGCPDLDHPREMADFFDTVQELVKNGLLAAYHDRSDGGLFACVAEMAMAGRRGVRLNIESLDDDPFKALFAEELGAVLQVKEEYLDQVLDVFRTHNLVDICHLIGRVNDDHSFIVSQRGNTVYSAPLTQMNRAWSELTYRMQALRDNPVCAAEEYDSLLDTEDPGMNFELTFDPKEIPAVSEARPKMAILREQGINGQIEMAAAFDRAGFEAIDVHMTDLIEKRTDLTGFAGLVACGGFSYGDVLGAGSGWAKSILYNPDLKSMFAAFFARPETFALGVCNGCQMLSQLKSIIPGAEHWPAFTKNISEQFEARYITVEVMESPSIFFKGMAGSRLPIPVAHGEGFADFRATGSADGIKEAGLAAVRYVDNYGNPAAQYPLNPNGSAEGLTGFTTTDGRVTVMMPHPERVFRSCQLSYRPGGFCDGEDGPWMKMFRNAREFVG